MFWEAVRFLFVFALVVVLAWAAARLAARLPRAGAHGALKVEAALSLGGNRGVYLLRVAGRLLLLGVAQEVTLLTELPGDAVPESAPAPAAPGGWPSRTLAAWVEEALRRWRPSAARPADWRGRLARLRRLVEELRGGDPH